MISRRDILKLFGLAGAATATAQQANAQSGALTLTLLHANDTHDRLEPTTISGTDSAGKAFRVQYGGVARIKTAIETLKRGAVNPVVLDAGDVFTGTIYGMIYKGLADLAYMEAFGVQAQTVGNHEFDNGPGQLADYIKNATFPVVSANIDASAEPLLKDLLKKSTLLEVAGQKVGIVGVTTPDTPIASSPGDKVKFLDPLTSVQAEVDRLRGSGVSKIIVLSHLGYSKDLELAAKLRGVGVIIGGHSHTPLGKYEGDGLPASQGAYPTVQKDAEGKTILVLQSWEWGKIYGSMRVTFSADGVPQFWKGTPVPVTSAFANDARLSATLRAFSVPIEAFRRNVVGTAAVRLNGDRADVRKRETNLANLIADANLWKTRSLGATISLQNGGGVRASIEAGPVTQGQLIDVQPFGNTLFVLELSGAEVVAALENGVSQWETGAGRFMHVAGLRYTFDLAQKPGSRVTKVETGNAKDGYVAIDRAKVYKVVTNNFVAAGGDGFDVLRNAKGSRVDTYFPDYQVMTEYMQFLKVAEPKVEGRITILNESK
ncbi:MAG: bifunctional metallophosphatase/5'-nucleotidase [Deinococcales bacterium]